jgi:hypothetical protein
MAKSIVFNRKRTQAVRLPAEMCFPRFSQDRGHSDSRPGADYFAGSVSVGQLFSCRQHG